MARSALDWSGYGDMAVIVVEGIAGHGWRDDRRSYYVPVMAPVVAGFGGGSRGEHG